MKPETHLNPSIINLGKTDYADDNGGSFFLGQKPGLFDSINRHRPQIWTYFNTMRSLDWNENEFGLEGAKLDFLRAPKAISSRMIRALAWQWEGDSVAARALLPVMAPFVTDSGLQAFYGRVTDNEVLHSLAYSEIVRLSFDDPSAVLNEILSVKSAHERMRVVGESLEKVYRRSHEYALGLAQDDDDTYDHAMLAVATFQGLEQCQFMPSFAVTFACGNLGYFMPPAKTIQKIAQDETEVHAAAGRYIIANEMKTARGAASFRRLRPTIEKLLEEIIESELINNRVMLGEGSGDEFPGLSVEMLDRWLFWCARPAYQIFGIPVPEKFKTSENMPLHYMKKWLDVNAIQAAPKEQENGQYKLNIVVGKGFREELAVNF